MLHWDKALRIKGCETESIAFPLWSGRKVLFGQNVWIHFGTHNWLLVMAPTFGWYGMKWSLIIEDFNFKKVTSMLVCSAQSRNLLYAARGNVKGRKTEPASILAPVNPHTNRCWPLFVCLCWGNTCYFWNMQKFVFYIKPRFLLLNTPVRHFLTLL